MKYSKYDLVLVGITFIQLTLQISWAFTWESFSPLESLGLFIFFSFLFYYNPIVITHNFLHTPFFKSKFLNQAFSVYNSALLSLPQSLYRYHHLNHHRYNNTKADPSSTLLYGKDGKQEHWIPYCALGLFRDGTQVAHRQILAAGEGKLYIAQYISTFVMLIIYCLISWKWFLIIYLPLFFFGFFLAHLENYFEHYNATDFENRFSNSVSFYNKFYNLLMFNEGYHQEHHISPQEHWTKRPDTYEKYKNELLQSKAYVAKNPPLLGFLD